MKKVIFIVLVCSLLLLVSCGKKDAESQQSIQDLINKQPGLNASTNLPVTEEIEQPAENTSKIINATKENVTEITTETPNIYIKCRYSAIQNAGCKWTDTTKTKFTIRLISSSYKSIPGVWFFFDGESGGQKVVKRTESIISKGTRTYIIDYESLVKEIGEIKRFEIYPIEEVNGTEYACKNQRVYTIPSAYCRPSEAVNIDNLTSS